ncbi:MULTISPECIES: hypothetical protein [Pseudomonas]|jgi:hypothetical protein|uniref:Uncharacterized protein n=1 Tax=Pseudomonas helleri TaxID=1608996 RepID=A0A7X1Y1N0_9PSED|nr:MULTISPECIES: hypothetical protein [Pseudomonas]MQU28767.1 hypothetical protein [Pseudomonas helleri]NNA13931.1 hypothetical protein [Pseudomonas lundensis]NNA42138.1 hypothetical protein [Pseudomonas lundensis]
MKAILITGALLCLSASVSASEFDFDYNDKNDMRGAYFMCSTTGFTQGDCPKVYQKCWLPPMIYRKKHKTKTYCVDAPNFSVSDSDKDRYLDEGAKRAEKITGE